MNCLRMMDVYIDIHTSPPTHTLSQPEDRDTTYRHKQVDLTVLCD